MTPRKPNMLEAFQASARAEQEQREAAANEAAPSATPGADAPAPEARAGAGGPFDAAEPATPPSPARQRAPENDELLGIAPRRTPGTAQRLPWIVAAVALGMVAMFFVGRDFGREAEAGPGDETPPAESDDPVVPAGPGPDEGGGAERATPSDLTAADLAFLSRENRFSVRAIQFDANPRGSKLALEAYLYLTELGYPAVAPITQGEMLVICVGAEPELNSELRRLRDELRQLPGPPPQSRAGEFDSAYEVNIADQIDDSLRR